VYPRAGLDDVERRKFLLLRGLSPNILCKFCKLNASVVTTINNKE
jgi:hypothetical protein